MAKRLKLYGREEVAAVLGISPKTLDRHIDAGRFPHPRTVAGRLVWTKEDIDVGIQYGDRFRAADTPRPADDDEDEAEKRASGKKSG